MSPWLPLTFSSSLLGCVTSNFRVFGSLLWSPWDSLSTGRENKHILSPLRQKVLRLCKLLFCIKIPCGICSKGFWNKINMLHTTGILISMIFPFLAYLMKISVIRRNLEHWVVRRNISLTAINSAFQIFFGERNVTLNLFVLKYYFLVYLQREKHKVKEEHKRLHFAYSI